MKIFHIELAKTGHGLSGGEKCMIEVIKYFKKKKTKSILLTTDNGKETYTGLGLKEDEFLEYITINTNWTETKFHIFFSYLIRPFYFLKIKNKIIPQINKKEDILMSHSDFFPNTISTKILSKYFKKKPYYWFHMLAPDIFKGYEGHFLKKFKFPSPVIIHYKLNQILFKILTKDAHIITVNPYYKKLFPKNKTYILHKFGGENIYIVKKYSGVKVEKWNTNKKIYDIVFLGRFHPQKGLFEIPKILKLLKEKKKDIKLLLIGGGNDKIKDKFFNIINKEGLSDNVDYKGFISSDEKFIYIRKSKVFVFPSYYESFGQVALEAMANGLPVVAYDLPIFCVFEKGMIKIPILDNKKFAEEILKLLKNEGYYRKKSKEALDYASTFSWEKTGEEIYNLINK